METRVPPRLEVRLLGRLSVLLDGQPVALPSSRKVRALLCFLAFAPRAVSRSQLCDLLWDTPDDPRGELRWCLSRLRSVIDTQERRRVVTSDDSVALDLANVRVDALEVLTAIDEGLAAQSNERLAELRALLGGELAAGLDVDSSPAFAGWLVAQRRRLRGCEVAILEHSAAVAPDAEALAVIEKWLELAPFDRQAHERLLTLLARAGRLREAETHLQATERAFEAEGLDARPLVTAWRAARKGPTLAVTVKDTLAPVALAQPASARRASIAVMPFIDATGASAARGGAADALAHDVITRLAKLRSLFVIAQGSVFALHERRIGPEEAGRMLDVDYVVSGTLRREDSRLIISSELTETRSARIVWAERFAQGPADTLQVLDEIGNRIVAAIASEIEAIERNRAILKPPNSLDAWEAHHRGLWHMYLFNRADNERAREFFSTAVRLDPTFARAYAGLSFTHFQTVFQGWAPRQPEIELAYETAGRALMVDDRDPAAHWAMGRALWLRGEHAPAIVELEQSIDLSPNFAQGYYALAFVQSQAGDPQAAIVAADHSRHLSPFDPLLFGMLGARAMALVRLGRFEEAAAWSVKAAARPNAHQHILAIAALSQSLAGALDEARTYAVRIRKMSPGYGIADFLGAFHYDEAAVVAFREGARRIGWR